MKKNNIFGPLLALVAGLTVACDQPAETGRERATLALRAEATTGEGAIWHPGRQSLFWVDIEGQTLYEYLPGSGATREWRFDRMVSTVVPESDTSVVVSLQDQVVRVRLSDGMTTPIVDVPDEDGAYRCNDGKCDPAGRLWVGTMGLKGQKGSATLYCLGEDGVLRSRIPNVTISNGIVWSSDKKYLYYNDTPTGRIARYRYDEATGEIQFDGVAVQLEEGTGAPDGMTIDSEDHLWVAQWGGSGVYCYDPATGELLRRVEVPAPNVASCAFGGANLDTLYITTARAGMSAEGLEAYPLSGSVFRYVPGVRGVRANYFKGISNE